MRYLKWLGVAVMIVLVLGLGGYGLASYTSHKKLSQQYETHEADFPVPWPLSDEEVAKLRADGQADQVDALAHKRARRRGKHLVEARYACTECHGADFGGGTMVDDPALGHLYGPNLTAGKGGVVAEYTLTDWDRIVRHGVTPRGTSALMPSVDFIDMTDRELSDIIVYLRSLPPVDNKPLPSELGPLGRVLIATGEMELNADQVDDHRAAHRKRPPSDQDTIAFGRHLSQVCTGCHGPEFRGGPIASGPPSWPPAKNLTPHTQGLADWSFADFDRAMRQGKKRDGTKVAAHVRAGACVVPNFTPTR